MRSNIGASNNFIQYNILYLLYLESVFDNSNWKRYSPTNSGY